MQVFQRRVSESLVIGQDIVVTVLEIHPDWVRLGISDPNSCPDYWEETLYLETFEDIDEGSSLELEVAVR